MPENVEACVASITDDNPDMDESTAHAICKDMDNRGVLEAYMEAEPEGHDLRGLAQFRDAGTIQRTEQEGGILYKRICLLAPGVWTDAGSRQTVLYDGDAIRASADNWVDNQVNLMHGPALHDALTLGDIGEVRTDSIVVDDEDRLFADIYLHENTPASELAVELMDEALESDGKNGIDGPSVEITDDVTHFDDDRGLTVMDEMTFSGIGLVFNPASKPVELESQIRERAVAMAEDVGEAAGGLIHRVNSDGSDTERTQKLKGRLRHRRRMGENDFSDLSPDERRKVLADMQDDIEDLQRTLQSDEEFAMVEDLVGQYQEAGGEMDAPASDFVAWVDSETDADAGDMQGVLNAYLDDAGADSLEETPVAGLMEYVQEASGEGGEETEDGDGEGEMNQEELAEAVNTIGEYADKLDTVKDMLSEYRGDMEERVAEVEEEKEDLERRLQKLEDEPKKRSLAGESGDEFYDGDEASTESEYRGDATDIQV